MRPLRRSWIVPGMCAGLGLALMGLGGWTYTKAAVAQVLLERAWSDTLLGADDAAPWPWADIRPVLSVAVPRLGVTAIVLDGVSGEAMAFGPGRMENTPLPGQGGLSVLAAHRDTHFAFLKEVRAGDRIEVTGGDGRLRVFEVTEMKVVDADASGLYADAPGNRLALVTCWPFDSTTPGPERFVVLADLLTPG